MKPNKPASQLADPMTGWAAESDFADHFTAPCAMTLTAPCDIT
jgi:hypothetical protein